MIGMIRCHIIAMILDPTRKRQYTEFMDSLIISPAIWMSLEGFLCHLTMSSLSSLALPSVPPNPVSPATAVQCVDLS